MPLFPFWLVNVAPALFEVPVRTYVLATAIGIIPGTLAYTLVGNGLGGLIAAQERANPGCVEAGTCRIGLSRQELGVQVVIFSLASGRAG